MKSILYLLTAVVISGCSLDNVQQEEDLILNEADRRMENSSYESALLLYEQYMAQHSASPDISEAYRKGGECCYELAKLSSDTLEKVAYLKRGLKYLDQVYPLGDQYVKSLFGKGEIFVLQGEFDSAETYFSTISDNYPNHARSPKAVLELGRLISQVENSDSALKVFNRVIERYPESGSASTARYEIGYIYLLKGIDTLSETIISPNDLIRAVEQYELVSFESNAWDNAMFDRAYIHFLNHSYDSTRYFCSEVYEKAPESLRADNAVLYIGHAYRNQGELDTALIWYKKVIEEYPFSGAYDNALYRAGDYYYDRRVLDTAHKDKAINYLKRYIEAAAPANEKYQKAINKLGKMGVIL